MRAFFGRAVRYLERQPKPALALLALVMVVFVGLVDHRIGPEVTFSIFYVLPTALAAWFVGRRVALLICALSAVAWLWADRPPGHVYSHPAIPYWNATVRLGLLLTVTLTLLTLRRALERQIALAQMDALTGVANRRAFFLLAEAEIERHRRYGRPLTVVYMDIDEFKVVNDRLGHEAGDVLLRSVARTLREGLRATDLIARLGGDEFVILLPETPADGAKAASRNLQARLLAEVRGRGWPVTFSFGVVTFVRAPASVDEIIRVADRTMYRAKHAGKNQVRHDVEGETPAAPG